MKNIHRVAILGAGTMGARIAAHFANAGIASYLLDLVPADADMPARNKIAAAGLDAAKKSKPAAFMDPSFARLVTVGDAAHFPWLDDPTLVFSSIATLLRGDWPASAEKITTAGGPR